MSRFQRAKRAILRFAGPSPSLGLLCFLRLEGHGVSSNFPCWESYTFLPPPPHLAFPLPLRARARTHTHESACASSLRFPFGADYFMTGCDKW